MQIGKSSVMYIALISAFALLSLGVAYYRYMVQQDFVYFPTEEQVPSQFNLSSYSHL